MQFTIEARPLTSDTCGTTQTTIEAADPQDAISEFVRQDHCELVSFASPGTGRESIATVKKQDSVFLIRVYRN